MGNTKKTERKAFLIFLGLLVLIGLYILSPFLNVIVLSVAFAVLFEPLHERFLKWTKGWQNTSAILSVIAVLLFLVIPVGIILTLVTTQLADLVAPTGAPTSEATVSDFVRFLQAKFIQLGNKIEQFLGADFNLGPFFRNALSQLSQMVARYSPQVIAETANFFLHFFVMLILLMYLFRDGKRLIIAVIRITPMKDTYEHKLANEIEQTIRGIFYGNFIVGLIQATLATVGFYFLGIQGYLVWGSATFLMSFLPTIGTGAVILPLVLVLFVQGKTTQAIILALYGALIVGAIDNLLRPFLMKHNMHPMFLFLSVFGGLAVFGPIGLLLGPMLMALLTATVRIYAADFANTVLPPTQPRPKNRKLIKSL